MKIFDFIRFLSRNGEILSLGVRDTYQYQKAMDEYRKENPNCEFCGRGGKVDVHHKIPVAVSPERAADKTNMITLHRKPACHLVVGHLGNWKDYNINVSAVCKIMKEEPQ